MLAISLFQERMSSLFLCWCVRFGKQFELPLLVQSVIMIVTMLAMVHVCVRVRADKVTVTRKVTGRWLLTSHTPLCVNLEVCSPLPTSRFPVWVLLEVDPVQRLLSVSGSLLGGWLYSDLSLPAGDSVCGTAGVAGSPAGGVSGGPPALEEPQQQVHWGHEVSGDDPLPHHNCGFSFWRPLTTLPTSPMQYSDGGDVAEWGCV